MKIHFLPSHVETSCAADGCDTALLVEARALTEMPPPMCHGCLASWTAEQNRIEAQKAADKATGERKWNR